MRTPIDELLECGCRKVGTAVEEDNGHGGVIKSSWYTVEKCPKHMEEDRIRQDEEQKESERRSRYEIENAEPLSCEICGVQIGYVYENDLNGSKFYCNTCK